jgi:hypothetical protein
VVFLDRSPLPFAQLTRAPLISRLSVAPLLPCHCPANATRFPTAAAPPYLPRLRHRRLQPACRASVLHRKENCTVRRPPPASCRAVIHPPSRHRLHCVGWSQPPCAHALCSALPPSRDGAAKRQRTQSARRQAAALHTSRSRKQVGANGIGMGAGGGEAGQRAPWRSGGGVRDTAASGCARGSTLRGGTRRADAGFIHN